MVSLGFWQNIHEIENSKIDRLMTDIEYKREYEKELNNTLMLSDSDIIKVTSKILNMSTDSLNVLLELNLLNIHTLRRYVACKDYQYSLKVNIPQGIRANFVAKKYGFKPETVRRFFKRYPDFFKKITVSYTFIFN